MELLPHHPRLPYQPLTRESEPALLIGEERRPDPIERRKLSLVSPLMSCFSGSETDRSAAAHHRVRPLRLRSRPGVVPLPQQLAEVHRDLRAEGGRWPNRLPCTGIPSRVHALEFRGRQNEDTLFATRATLVVDTKKASEIFRNILSARRATMLPRFATDGQHRRTQCR